MQDNKLKRNEEIKKALSLVLRDLQGKKTKTTIAGECEVPRSVIKYIMDGTKDPQLTTLWRLAEGFYMKPSEFLKLIEDKLPKGWSIFEE